MANRENGADTTQIVLSFENNRLAGELFGQFDQHLARVEQRLEVEAVARGNTVTLSGGVEECEIARLAFEGLYERLVKGDHIEMADMDGAIRLAEDTLNQLALPQIGKAANKNSIKRAYANVSTRRKTVTARTPAQDSYLRALQAHEMIFATGPAGTGKTYLAVAYAASLLERGEVNRIILSRPAVEAGERLGFLPGDMKEKVDPYLRPLYDALYDMMPAEKVDRGLQSGMIEVAPLAFMRGRTLSEAAVLLDEAQNTTPMQMKMFLTRLGEGSKMIINGDPSQVDLPRGQKSGLVEALDLLENVEGIARVRFSHQDVVRHELVGRIVRAYDTAGSSKNSKETKSG
ncbi:MAG: PhoH family protein [Cohaesibacteraceae bacterium]|nr:PhoH family protein [Cohaesibacteraceae bacterium]MBL4875122.1 PhoH family protein [Cohaesibacteraceae bacterium]